MYSSEELIKPDPLEYGDPVSIVTPVNLPPQIYRDDEAILNYLQNCGFNPTNRTADNDTKAKRANSFNEAVISGDKALFPIAGNRYGSDFLHRIDYEAFAKHKPIFTTFSAASAVLLALHYRSNVEVFYGPHVSFMYDKGAISDTHFSINSFWNMLSMSNETNGIIDDVHREYCFKWDEDSLVLRNPFSRGAMNWDRQKSNIINFIGEKSDQSSSLVEGRLIPTFINSLKEAIALGVEVKFENKILMIEGDEMSYDECFEIISTIERFGGLHNASAIVLCSFVTHKRNPPNIELTNALYNPIETEKFTNKVRSLLKHQVPVIFGFPMGHLKHKLTVPMGVSATVDLESGDIKLNESPFNSDRKS
jgi:muramoyltetrapeptide carboxypeptidase LdcA involved in peptidoglycan recycling